MFKHKDSARKDPVAFMVGNGFNFFGLPESLRKGYAYWWCFGIPAGSFLQAVIENKFMDVAIKADDTNLGRLREIALWFYNSADYRAIGQNAKSWGERGGYFGRIEEADGEGATNGL